MLNKKMVDVKPIPLRWYDINYHNYFSAGIGFYNGSYGDYTLKLNTGIGKIYLRPVSYEDNQTRFRVELVKQDNGRIKKETIGIGYLDETTKGSIHIKLGGYSDILILG